MVGDGASDQKAALLADVLFAKDGLARWCDRAGVPYHPFATLADVQRRAVRFLTGADHGRVRPCLPTRC